MKIKLTKCSDITCIFFVAPKDGLDQALAYNNNYYDLYLQLVQRSKITNKKKLPIKAA